MESGAGAGPLTRRRGDEQRRVGLSIRDSAAVRGAGAAADEVTGPVMGLGAAGCRDFGSLLCGAHVLCAFAPEFEFFLR